MAWTRAVRSVHQTTAHRRTPKGYNLILTVRGRMHGEHEPGRVACWGRVGLSGAMARPSELSYQPPNPMWTVPRHSAEGRDLTGGLREARGLSGRPEPVEVVWLRWGCSGEQFPTPGKGRKEKNLPSANAGSTA